MRTIALLALPAVLVACQHPFGSDPTLPPISPAQAQASTAPASTAASAAPAHATPPGGSATGERFDDLVRNDFFDGLRGDAAALDRVVKLCEDTLAKQPGHPEAMVWHGAAMIGRAAVAIRSGDRAAGQAMFAQGLGEMDRAVEIAPNNAGVRLPRGAVLLTAAPFVPEPQKSGLLRRGVSDYEVALAAQAPRFSTLSLHAREQLLYGLTEGYAGLGEPAKAQAYYQRMTRDAAGSPLLARAKARAAGEAVSGPTPCEQCHAR